MATIILIIHLMLAVALVATVLLQRSEGGALGIGGGGDGFMTGRGAGNALTRATAILAALFMTTSLALGIIATHGGSADSVLDSVTLPGETEDTGDVAVLCREITLLSARDAGFGGFGRCVRALASNRSAWCNLGAHDAVHFHHRRRGFLPR